MTETPLYELYRLHLVDIALLEMKQRAAALDGGASILQAINTKKAEFAAILELPKAIQAEIKELEDKNAAHAAKIKQIEKDLYGGKIVNPKEIAAFEQDVLNHKKHLAANEERMLELMEQAPDADRAALPIRQELQVLAKKFEAKKAADIAASQELQAAYKAKQAERPPLAARVSKPLLAQYDAIRQKYGGVGMGVVSGARCSACGTTLPTKIVEALKEDRIISCESCHRLLIKLVQES